MSTGRRAGSREPEAGSALVEMVWLSLLLLVPLVYVVLVASSLQRAAFATTAAAREGGRAYAGATDDASGRLRAGAAARLALADQHVPAGAGSVTVECGDCTFAPGSSFRVVVRSVVRLPWLPTWLCPQRSCPVSIPVRASHAERLDCYRAVDPPATRGPGC